jgi:hypothetical protein
VLLKRQVASDATLWHQVNGFKTFRSAFSVQPFKKKSFETSEGIRQNDTASCPRKPEPSVNTPLYFE